MRQLLISLIVLAFAFVASAQACPLVTTTIGTVPVVDFNCDQQVRWMFAGDSITKGIGDRDMNEDNGGYPRFLEDFFPQVEFVNLGFPGASSSAYLRAIKKNIAKGKPITTSKASDNDLIMFLLGTNDYWQREKYPASQVPTYIKRIQKFLKKYYTETLGITAPHTVVATLPPTQRSFQNPYIAEVNKFLLKLAKPLNVRIRFDNLDASKIIGPDALHPNRKGYRQMAKIAKKPFLKLLQKQMKKNRPDKDGDGIYDIFEVTKFGTDNSLLDTDGDTISDGTEVFSAFTNPLDSSDF